MENPFRYVRIVMVMAAIPSVIVTADDVPNCRLHNGSDVIRIEIPTEDRAPKLLLLFHTEYEVPGWGLVTASTSSVPKDGLLRHNGREFVKGFSLQCETESDFRVGYPGLTRGDLVPLGHCVARYEGLVHGVVRECGDRFADMTFRLLPRKDVPESARRHADTWALPMWPPWAPPPTRGGVAGRLNERQLRLMSITALPDGAAVARISINSRWEHFVTVQAGDTVTLKKYPNSVQEYRVHAVVPPDEQTRVIGWVELDFKPIDSNRAK